MRFELATPTRMLVSTEAEEVVAPGVEGYFGVLPGHAAFLTTLAAGEVMYRTGQRQEYLAVAGGFAEVRAERVIILAEHAEQGARPRSHAALGRGPSPVPAVGCPVRTAPEPRERTAGQAPALAIPP